MTDKTDLIREIHEYVTTHGGENTATHLLVQAASAIQTQAAELEAIGAGGVSGPLMGRAPEGMVRGWIALPGTLPKPGTPVLLDIGKEYPIRAMWAAKHTVQAADDDADWGEYVEADDMYYAPEGWYEWNQCEDNHWRVTETPRAWMPLPPASAEGVEP